jgi:deazaflavin-dependent oxidoreductase (nitroreductase family)
MKPRYEKPPYQPRWVLQAQVWLLRRHLLPSFNQRCMIITTTGRKTGRRWSVPIGFVRDGSSYLAINAGGNSNWYRNALAMPYVTLEVEDSVIETCAEAVHVDSPEQLQFVLDVYRHQSPSIFENFLGISLDAPAEELMDISKYVAFMRFYPLH